MSKQQASVDVLEGNPIRVRNLAMPYGVFVTIKNYTIHNNTVVADTLFASEDEIEADFYHTKETNISIKGKQAGDLIIRLLRMGIMVHFLDDSASIIKKMSPPLYNKYYSV